jgi:iron complex transport system substrate-binding protein
MPAAFEQGRNHKAQDMKSARPRTISALAGVAALLLATQAAATQYPLTIENCGRELTFESAPDRVVSIGQNGTEMLYHLDLADVLRGTALWRSDVLAEFAAVNAKIERLADNDPSFESIVAKRPQLVIADLINSIGPNGRIGTPEQFADLGIEVYVLPDQCTDIGPGASGGAGARYKPFVLDQVYHGVSDLARIFNRNERGAALIADLKAREAAAKARVADVGEGISAVFWYSSASPESDPWVAGQNGVQGYMARTLGVTNVVDVIDDWPTVGWETIARANPTVIVVPDLTRRRYPLDAIEVKRDFLREDPVTRFMDAVENDRIVPLDPQEIAPSLRLVDGIEKLAESIAAIKGRE